jgi:hypothetical protein
MKKVRILAVAIALVFLSAACASDDNGANNQNTWKPCDEITRAEMEETGCCCEYGMVGNLECGDDGQWYCSAGTYWYGSSECESDNGPCFTPSFEPDVTEHMDPGFSPDEGTDPGSAPDQGVDALNDPGSEPDTTTLPDVPADVPLTFDPGSAPDMAADMGTPPSPDPGMPDPGMPDPGMPDPGMPDPGTPDPGTPDPIDVATPQDTAPPTSNAPWAMNLVTNPGAEDNDLSGWNILQSGGDGWAVSGSPYAGAKSFITSYGPCLRSQEIDLLAWSFTEEELDNVPLVMVSEWFKEMYDGGDMFKLTIELRDASGEPLASWIQEGETAGGPNYGDDIWFELAHTFSDYGPGLRTIYWEDGGQDGEYWAGHYGIRMDEASIQLIPDTD